MSPFSVALRYFLENSEWTEETLAAEIGFSQGYINALRNGKREGKENVRVKIAQAFGFDYFDFLKLGQKLKGFGKEPKIRDDRDQVTEGPLHWRAEDIVAFYQKLLEEKQAIIDGLLDQIDFYKNRFEK